MWCNEIKGFIYERGEHVTIVRGKSYIHSIPWIQFILYSTLFKEESKIA